MAAEGPGAPAAEPPGAGEVLRMPGVARLLAAQLLGSLAFGMMGAALSWQAYQRSGSTAVLGGIGLAEFIPAMLLAIPAGHAADRYDRRLVTAIGNVGTCVVAVLFALDAASGDAGTWPLYVLAALAGAARAFTGPAFTPMLAAAVDAIALPGVMAISSVTWQAALIGGPFLGGALQALGDPQPYIAAAVAEAAALALVLGVPRRIGTDHTHDARKAASLADAFDGLWLILRTPALLGAISLDLVAVLFGGATALLSVFAADVLDLGAVGYGLLRAAPGIGAVLVGVVLAVRPVRRRVGPTLLVVVALFGVFTIIFGVSTTVWLSFLALAALAGADMVSVMIRSTLAPVLTPPALRGRVAAVERVFIGASNELGAAESGFAAALLGPVGAVVLGGVASIAVAVLWGVLFPALRRIDRYEDLEQSSALGQPGAA